MGKTWDQRKGLYKSIQVDRDLADLFKLIANDAGQSIARLVSDLTRHTAEAKARLVMEKKLRGLAEKAAGAERKARKQAAG